MAFKKPKPHPQFADLLGILAQSRQTENPLYQVIQVLIERLTQNQKAEEEALFNALNEPGNEGLKFATRFATFLTEEDETSHLPNSRQLIPGTNITFDTTVDGQLEINASEGETEEWSVLTNGDVTNGEIIFADGDVIMTHQPFVSSEPGIGGGGGGGGSEAPGFIAEIDYQNYTGSTSVPYHLRDEDGASLGTCSIETSSLGPGTDNGVRIWNWEHVASGGFNDRAYMRTYWWATTGDSQEDTGLNLPVPDSWAPPGGWVDDVEYFIRIRVRMNGQIVNENGNEESSTNNKWFFAPAAGDDNNRAMLHMCNLRYNEYLGTTSGFYLDPDVYPPEQYNKFRIMRDQAPVSADQGVAVCPLEIGVWESIQCSFTFGATPVLKVWWRSHVYASPFNSCTITDGGVPGLPWNNPLDTTEQARFGGYLSDSILNDITWDVDSWIISLEFDSTWGD